jgi:hypothetical protein
VCKTCVSMAGAGILAVSLSGILHHCISGESPTLEADVSVALIGMAIGILISVPRKPAKESGSERSLDQRP